MKEKENEIPRKELPRSSDIANRRSKDSPAKKTSKKIAGKSLTEAFVSPIEDVLPKISEEFIDLDADFNGETAESFVMDSYPSLSTSSETFIPSELTPCSKINTVNRDEQIDFSKTGSAEVEIMVNLLIQARLQAMNSVDMDNKSKKVLDALIKFTIKEFYTLPEEIDKLPQLLSRNAFVVFLCFLLWVVAALLFSFYSRVACSFTGPPPT